jgi:hypothetical protein
MSQIDTSRSNSPSPTNVKISKEELLDEDFPRLSLSVNSDKVTNPFIELY